MKVDISCHECAVRWSCALEADGPEFEPCKRHRIKEEKTNIDEFGVWTQKMWFSGNAPKGQDLDPSNLRSLAIMTMGLMGETGEVCEKIKKFIRDDNLDLENLKKELGDVIHYWARICVYFGLAPSVVIEANMAKINDRAERGVMRGSGDNR